MKRALNSEDFYIQNDYIDDLVNNLEDHPYEEILYYSMFYINPEYLFDYMLLNCGMNEKEEILKQGLINLGCYEKYLNSVFNSDDDFLKAHIVLFLENDLLNVSFKSIHDLVKSIIKNDYYSVRYKIYDLLVATEFECNDETVNLIKKTIVKYIEDYDENLSENDIKILKNTYLALIDENQSYYKNNSYNLKK